MTPAARVAAAIEVLDDVLSGQTAERALKRWGRSHRFAGSKDRAAIRDHVFQALRCRASYAWLGGAETGRGIMLGAARASGQEGTVFTGEGHAPPPVLDHEAGALIEDAPRAIKGDVQTWLLEHFDRAFAQEADDVLATLRDRAGVFLRVNLAKATLPEAKAALAAEGIESVPIGDIKTALQVTANERKVSNSKAYLSGMVELQDPSSQEAVLSLDLAAQDRVLDFCAGGGGKALSMAALGADVTAHDIDAGRMVDLGPRAQRAGARIATASADDLNSLEPFDLVFCDAPCSGSGTWRRTPEAKWALTPERLQELIGMQDDVLDAAAPLVRVQGRLAYATCSVFDAENADRVARFLASNTGFAVEDQKKWRPSSQCDGFFLTVFKRAK